MRLNKFVVTLLSITLLYAFSIRPTAAYAQANANDIQKKIEEAIRLRDKDKNINAAMKLLKEVLTEEPRNFVASVFLAEIYMNMGDLENASKSLDNALSANPSNAFALRVKGDLLIQQNKYKEAEEALNKALASSAPKSSDHALAYLGLTKLYLKQGEKAKAKAYLEKAIEDDPANPAFKQQMKALESADTK